MKFLFPRTFLDRILKSGRVKVVRTLSSISTKGIDYDDDLTVSVKHSIEAKWGSEVKKTYFDINNEEKEKSYVLAMFPYPSGNLHMGHVRVYTISDTIARFHRLLGKNVFHPMGFDAFGLPAENAAVERGISPKEWTKKNIINMRQQLKQLGCSFDWDYEIITSSHSYFKFTQYLFLLMYKAGLVYQKEACVNWDPVDKTVLADEQVDKNGYSWRSAAKVEKKIMKQWFIRTTWFAERLWKGLNNPKLKDWKDVVKLQKHWIGSCIGSSFDFVVVNEEEVKSTLTIWTRYPEFVKHAAFIAASSTSVLAFQENRSGKLDLKVINPFTNKKLPVFITDEVDFDEGSDLKIGLPNFYETDKIFAAANDIPFNLSLNLTPNIEERQRICKLSINAGIGGYLKSSKLRDWLISRQRTWGTPIPIVHCKKCGPLPVNFDDLPIEIDRLDVRCPRCSSPGNLEKDTMDTFVDSSWYFLRYIDPHNDLEPFDKVTLNRFMPVDVYIGGKEHATLHLYYARFISHFLHSIGYLHEAEPFKCLLVQGMVLGKTYKINSNGKYISKEMVNISGKTLSEIKTGALVTEEWEKMSKSKFNGVEPNEILQKYGIDTTRLLILSDVAPTSHKYWTEESFTGIINWQKRLWSLMGDFLKAKKYISKPLSINELHYEEKLLKDARNYYTKGITFNYTSSHQLSVAISKLQGFTNSLKRTKEETKAYSLEFEKALASFIIMISPMTPHFASEMWSSLQEISNYLHLNCDCYDIKKPVLAQKWPIIDDDYNLELICKVNNAVKSSIALPYEKFKRLNAENAHLMALSDKKVYSFIGGCDILDSKFNVIDNYEAVINIIIDHRQKKI